MRATANTRKPDASCRNPVAALVPNLLAINESRITRETFETTAIGMVVANRTIRFHIGAS